MLNLHRSLNDVSLKDFPGSGYLWLIVWFAFNLCLTLQNKWLLSFSFSFPLALSACHVFVTWMGSLCLIVALDLDVPRFTKQQQLQLAAFSVLYCLNIAFGNLVLQFVSVAFLQIVRSIIPAIALLLSYLVLGKSVAAYFWAILVLCGGVMMASFGDVEFSWIGLAVALLVCFLSALKSVVTSLFFQQDLAMHPVVLLFYMSRSSFFQMVLLSFLSGEIFDISNTWYPAQPEVKQIFLLLGLNALIAFGLNISNFVTTKKTSAVTLTVAGNLKHVSTILFSVVIFQTPVPFINGCGMVITILGAAYYSWIETEERKQKGKDSEASPV